MKKLFVFISAIFVFDMIVWCQGFDRNNLPAQTKLTKSINLSLSGGDRILIIKNPSSVPSGTILLNDVVPSGNINGIISIAVYVR